MYILRHCFYTQTWCKSFLSDRETELWFKLCFHFLQAGMHERQKANVYQDFALSDDGKHYVWWRRWMKTLWRNPIAVDQSKHGTFRQGLLERSCVLSRRPWFRAVVWSDIWRESRWIFIIKIEESDKKIEIPRSPCNSYKISLHPAVVTNGTITVPMSAIKHRKGIFDCPQLRSIKIFFHSIVQILNGEMARKFSISLD